MGYNTVDYRRGVDGTPETGSGLSGFWGDCPIARARENQRLGFGAFEDGLAVPRIVSSANIISGYVVHMTGTGDFGTTDDPGGGLVLETGATGDNETSAQYGGGIADVGSYRISDTATEARKLWFEVALEVDNVTLNQMSAFWGLLVGLNLSGDDILDDSHVFITTLDFIGFRKKAGDSNLVDVVYQADSGGVITLIDGDITLELNTIIRLGFKYDPSAPASRQITFFVNGIPKLTYVTAANIAAATFPDAVMMQPTFIAKTNTTVATKLTLHNWGCFQLR